MSQQRFPTICCILHKSLGVQPTFLLVTMLTKLVLSETSAQHDHHLDRPRRPTFVMKMPQRRFPTVRCIILLKSFVALLLFLLLFLLMLPKLMLLETLAQHGHYL